MCIFLLLLLLSLSLLHVRYSDVIGVHVHTYASMWYYNIIVYRPEKRITYNNVCAVRCTTPAFTRFLIARRGNRTPEQHKHSWKKKCTHTHTYTTSGFYKTKRWKCRRVLECIHVHYCILIIHISIRAWSSRRVNINPGRFTAVLALMFLFVIGAIGTYYRKPLVVHQSIPMQNRLVGTKPFEGQQKTTRPKKDQKTHLTGKSVLIF